MRAHSMSSPIPGGSQWPPLIAPNNVTDNAHRLPNLSCNANFLAIRPTEHAAFILAGALLSFPRRGKPEIEEVEMLELRMANYDPSVGAAVLHAYLSGETQIKVFGSELALDEFASKYRQILEAAGMNFTKRRGYCLIEKTVSS